MTAEFLLFAQVSRILEGRHEGDQWNSLRCTDESSYHETLFQCYFQKSPSQVTDKYPAWAMSVWEG